MYKKENMRCHECRHDMFRDNKPMILEYKDNTISINLDGWYCSNCEESVHSGKDMQKSDKALFHLKSKLIE